MTDGVVALFGGGSVSATTTLWLISRLLVALVFVGFFLTLIADRLSSLMCRVRFGEFLVFALDNCLEVANGRLFSCPSGPGSRGLVTGMLPGVCGSISSGWSLLVRISGFGNRCLIRLTGRRFSLFSSSYWPGVVSSTSCWVFCVGAEITASSCTFLIWNLICLIVPF